MEDTDDPNWYRLRVNFNCRTDHSDNTIELYFEWIVDDEVIKTDLLVPYADQPFTLSEAELQAAGITHFNKTVSIMLFYAKWSPNNSPL